MTGRSDTTVAGRRLVIVLGIVTALLVALVVHRYWPGWVGELGGQALDWLRAHVGRIWRDTGGRWVVLAALVAGTAIGLLLTRRSRILGVTLIEVAVAAAAVVALLQPTGW